jgi:hypothetical protein
MLCECKLPCRNEPVNEADAFYCTAFVLLCAAVAVFLIHAGYLVEVWLPLAGGAVLCGMIAGHYDAKRLASRPRQAEAVRS